MSKPKSRQDVGAVRPDFIPAADYISRDFLQREKERLWPRVWQMACREEEIPKPGDFYTYDIADESIAVVRQRDGSIGAYHNACPHRGRRLTSGCGRAARFHCRFHGWQWELDGKPRVVVDREDWGAVLQDEDISLMSVRVETWGGWVFINMDDEAESLHSFLEPAKALLDPFAFDRMRYRWRKETVLPANWKTALEAFSEAYHVQTTHRQLLPGYHDMTYSRAYGRHGMFGNPIPIYGLPSPRISDGTGDPRKGLVFFYNNLWDTLEATMTAPMVAAANRLMELPEGTSLEDTHAAHARFHKEETDKLGRPWPDVTPEQMMAAGIDWHLFPNMVFLHQPTNLLGYRARPNGDDPDSCIFEVYVLELFAPGEEPKTEVVKLDYQDPAWGLILTQDFQNMHDIQRGLKSRGFRGARPSPVQERSVSNFHRALHEFMAD